MMYSNFSDFNEYMVEKYLKFPDANNTRMIKNLKFKK